MDDMIETAWDVDADRHQKLTGNPIARCRDDVIIVWLNESGDGRPFAYWVLRGHVPDKRVVGLLAQMLDPQPDTKSYVQFSLVKKRRDGRKGAVPDRVGKVLNRLLAEHVSAKMDQYGPGTYDAAIRETAEIAGLPTRAVKAAHGPRSETRKARNRSKDK